MAWKWIYNFPRDALTVGTINEYTDPITWRAYCTLVGHIGLRGYYLSIEHIGFPEGNAMRLLNIHTVFPSGTATYPWEIEGPLKDCLYNQ